MFTSSPGSGVLPGAIRVTNGNGEVVFNLPDRSYKVRADYLGRQYWSEVFQWQDETVTIPIGNAEITVTGSGLPLASVKCVRLLGGECISRNPRCYRLEREGRFSRSPQGLTSTGPTTRAVHSGSSEEPLVAGQTKPRRHIDRRRIVQLDRPKRCVRSSGRSKLLSVQ